MKDVYVDISVPEGVPSYFSSQDKNKLIRDAMKLYPLIKNQTISHGRAAAIIGIKKMDLIELYSSLGIPYLAQSEDELRSDLSVLESL